MLNDNLLVVKEKKASGRLITDCERVVGNASLTGLPKVCPSLAKWEILAP
jgi:hypothetical protein